VLYWAVWALPFFCGAAVIGLALMVAGDRVAAVYAVNLIGSAAGAVFATVMMHVLPPEWLPLVMGALGIAGAAGLMTDGERGQRKAGWPMRLATLLVGTGVVVVYLWLDRPRVRLDPYKYLAYVRRLAST
jgi:hypothetical protein